VIDTGTLPDQAWRESPVYLTKSWLASKLP